MVNVVTLFDLPLVFFYLRKHLDRYNTHVLLLSLSVAEMHIRTVYTPRIHKTDIFLIYDFATR